MIKFFPYFLVGTGVSAGGLALGFAGSGENSTAQNITKTSESKEKLSGKNFKTKEEIKEAGKQYEDSFMKKTCIDGEYTLTNQNKAGLAGNKGYTCTKGVKKEYFLTANK